MFFYFLSITCKAGKKTVWARCKHPSTLSWFTLLLFVTMMFGYLFTRVKKHFLCLCSCKAMHASEEYSTLWAQILNTTYKLHSTTLPKCPNLLYKVLRKSMVKVNISCTFMVSFLLKKRRKKRNLA